MATPRHKISFSNTRVLPIAKKRMAQARFPRASRRGTLADVNRSLKSWAAERSGGKRPLTELRFKAVALTRQHLKIVSTIQNSETPLVELVKHGLDLPGFAGILFSASAGLEYSRDLSRFKVERAKIARVKVAQARKAALSDLDEAWTAATTEYAGAHRRAGLKEVDADALYAMARELTGNQKWFSDFVKIYEPAKSAVSDTPLGTAIVEAVAGKSPSQVIPDRHLRMPPDWCGIQPIEGTFTEHVGASFSLTITMTIPCGVKWKKKKRKIFGVTITYWVPDGIKYCTVTLGVAELSFYFGIELGYKLDCCGPSVWGAAATETCAAVAGIEKCARCDAWVAAIGGMARVTMDDGTCAYGIGITLGVDCQVAGVSVYGTELSYGWVVTGPCAPVNLLCA
jgi:hypothetical protein